MAVGGRESGVGRAANGKRQPAGEKTTLGMRPAPAVGMKQITSFRDLDVWQRSMDLVDLVSIPSNVAGGYRRKRQLAYQNHVSIALGSHGEMETELEVAFRNEFLSRARCKDLLDLSDRVGSMLYRLHESLEP